MLIRICYKTPKGPTSIDVLTMYEAINFMKEVGEDDLISVTKVINKNKEY